MGITLPADLAEIAGQVGVQWPQADETAMHNAAQAWRTAAAKLTTLAKDADKTASDALGAMSGQAADAADDFWGKFVHGENAKFTQAVQGCLAAADRLEQAAQKIGAAKVEIVRKLTTVSQQSGAAKATPGDLSKAGLSTLLSGAGADINGILGDLTDAVNPSTLTTPTVSADAPAAFDGADHAVGPNGGLLGLSAGLPNADDLMSGPSPQVALDPATGQYVDKTTGQVVDPKTGLPVLPGAKAGPLGDDAPTGQFPVGGPHPAASAPTPDNSAEPTGPVPRNVINANTPPDYGHQGGYSPPPPVYSDPTPTGPVHIPSHVPQSTTVQSAAPVYTPPPAPAAPSYQPPSGGGGGNTYWTPPAVDNPAPVGSGPVSSAPGMPGPRASMPPAFGQPGLPGAPGQPGMVQPGGPAAGGPVAGGVVAGGPGAAVAGGVGPGAAVAGGAGQPGQLGGGQPGGGQAGGGQPFGQQPGGAAQGAGAAAIVNTTRRPGPGDVAGVFVDDQRPAAVVKPVVKQPTVAPGLFMVYMFPIGHMPTPSSRPARQLPPPPAEVDYAAGLRFPPHDHPESGLIQHLGAADAEVPSPRSGEESGLADGYDSLGGENERDWDRRFLVRAGAEERRAEYAWPPGELFPEGGCDAGEAVILEPGVHIDRFGTPEGRVFSVDGTPFPQRSLPPEHLDAGYRRYKVLAPLPMWQTISAAWFGQPGGGVRYRSVYPAADLVALGYLEAVA